MEGGQRRGRKLKLRVELRGGGTNGLPRQTMLEQAVTPGYFRRWTSLTLAGADYKNFGNSSPGGPRCGRTTGCWPNKNHFYGERRERFDPDA